MACKVRGATIIEPSADEIVAAANPVGMSHQPWTAMLPMTKFSVSASCAGLAEAANFQAIKR